MTTRSRARHLVVVLAPVLVLALAGACSDGRGFAALPDPEAVTTLPATTTSRPDLSGVALAEVRGTTTTTVALVAERGNATLVGRVDGPDGPVGGGTVLVERLVGDGVASASVPTAADGTWNLTNVIGGRYRIRVWRVPDLAMGRAEIFFLRAGQTRAVEQRLEAVGGDRVDTVVAPNPPRVGAPTNVKVRLATRSVDDDGIVRTRARTGISVRLGGTGAWRVQGENPQTTAGDGAVTFTLVCDATGPQPLTATLDGGETVALPVPDCATTPPTTTSTTSVTPTSDPDGATTTTTAGGATTTSTTTSDG